MKNKLGLGLLFIALSGMVNAAEKPNTCGELFFEALTDSGRIHFTICKNDNRLHVSGVMLEDGSSFWDDDYKIPYATYTASAAEKVFRLPGTSEQSRRFDVSEANVEGETHYVVMFTMNHSDSAPAFIRLQKPTVNKLNQLF